MIDAGRCEPGTQSGLMANKIASASAGACRTKPPERRSDCPISYSLDIFGERWTLRVIRGLVPALPLWSSSSSARTLTS
jgi:hypothetical protein